MLAECTTQRLNRPIPHAIDPTIMRKLLTFVIQPDRYVDGPIVARSPGLSESASTCSGAPVGRSRNTIVLPRIVAVFVWPSALSTTLRALAETTRPRAVCHGIVAGTTNSRK
jgi:hypothetical protein